jgi:hypothetical protein
LEKAREAYKLRNIQAEKAITVQIAQNTAFTLFKNTSLEIFYLDTKEIN